MAKWLPPNGFTGRVQHLDASVGGSYRMSFTNFTTGNSHAFGGEHLELVPHETMRDTGQFDDPNLPDVMQTSATLRAGLIDELHLAVRPILLGSGEHLWDGLDLHALGYACTHAVAGERATHVFLSKRA